MLHVVGVSNVNLTFSCSFAFLSGETQDDYLWALTHVKAIFKNGVLPSVIITDRELALMNAVSVIFPRAANLLCVWHINKNIVANVKKNFATNSEFDKFMKNWSGLTASKTLESFEEGWQQMVLSFGTSHDTALRYVEETWLSHREKFVHVWTDHVRHFGRLVTSRAEGQHHAVKIWLPRSTINLLEAVSKISLSVTSQYKKIEQAIAYQKARRLTLLGDDF